MKLNIACGNEIKENWINIDIKERDQPLDYEIDVTKEFPFEDNSVDEIYMEQFLEHLNWLDGRELLEKCFKSMKEGAKIRIVVPNIAEAFHQYLGGNKAYFKPYFDSLNIEDLNYYISVSNKLRARHYDFTIDILNYMVYQYGEHKCMFSFDSLESLLLSVGFSEVYESEFKEEYDSDAPTRKDFSLYVEGFK